MSPGFRLAGIFVYAQLTKYLYHHLNTIHLHTVCVHSTTVRRMSAFRCTLVYTVSFPDVIDEWASHGPVHLVIDFHVVFVNTAHSQAV